MLTSNSEESGDGVLLQLCADDAELAGHGGTAGADIDLARNMIKVQPCAVLPRNNALGTQNDAVSLLVVQRGQNRAKLVLGVFLGRLDAPAHKDLVGVMVTVMVVMVLVLMVMIMVMLVVVIVMVLMLLATVRTIAILAVLMVMMLVIVMVLMLVLVVVVVIVIVMMLMLLAAMRTIAILAVLMVMMLLLMRQQLCQLVRQIGLTLHCLQNLCTGQLIPRGCDDKRLLVVLSQKRNGCVKLFGRNLRCPTEQNR